MIELIQGASTIELCVVPIFLAMLGHTFLAKKLGQLAHVDLKRFDFSTGEVKSSNGSPRLDKFLVRHEWLTIKIFNHRGLFHFVGETEAVPALWALVLFGVIFVNGILTADIAWVGPVYLLSGFTHGLDAVAHYIDKMNWNEPLFVFFIMMVASSRPFKQLAETCMLLVASLVVRFTGLPTGIAMIGTLLSVGPILGSLITEPAAITITSLLLAPTCFEVIKAKKEYHRLRYQILTTLLVNISVGGVLTSFAAPPVVMVAHKWHWDSWFMLKTFGWKAVIAVLINVLLLLASNWKSLKSLEFGSVKESEVKTPIPVWIYFSHVVLLCGLVYFSHHIMVCAVCFAVYFGLAQAYPQYQDERLFFRESTMVAIFLAGLVTVCTNMQHWLEPILTQVSGVALFGSAIGLTAVADNAMITYMVSLVDGLGFDIQYLAVAGAVVGGGLTVIANAPNPAAFGILEKYFGDSAISSWHVFKNALRPTTVAALIFLLL